MKVMDCESSSQDHQTNESIFVKHSHHNLCGALWSICVHWLAFALHVLAFLVHRSSAFISFVTFVGLKTKLLHASVGVNGNSRLANSKIKSPVYQQRKQTQGDIIGGHWDFLLPPRSLDDLHRLTVVLDLDETLVCAYESSNLPYFVKDRFAPKSKSFELNCIVTDKYVAGKQKVNHVTVFERPGLNEFLARISEFAEVILFTAGIEGYAKPLVDKIDSKGYISSRLYRQATVTTKYRQHVKDLSRLARDLRRTVLVDNNPFSFLLQPLNGIPCVPFTGSNTEDNQLLEVLLPLLKHLATEKDVRPVLSEKFQMPHWFQKQGIPASDWPL